MLPHQIALVSDTPTVSHGAVSRLSAALQKQAVRDFGPLWGVTATVDAFDTLEDIPIGYWPIIVRDDINSPGAAGYHTDDHGQPFSLVQADSGWALTASHECLEMLADPFGSRTVAGSPPQQATGKAATLERVEYLVEVCDPCESDQLAYTVNRIHVSDFITPQYYDPEASASRFSFRGNIKRPHEVLPGGYVSFGDPITNEWFQIQYFGDQPQTVSLGVLNTQGKSLREAVDLAVRRQRPGYRTQQAFAMAAGAAPMESSLNEPGQSSAGRASSIRKAITNLH